MADSPRRFIDDDFAVNCARLDDRDFGIHGGKAAVYLIKTKPLSDVGIQFAADPLRVIRDRIPDIGIDDDWTAALYRPSAEFPENTREWQAHVWVFIPQRRLAVGIAGVASSGM
jgi:hypothetical protein